MEIKIIIFRRKAFISEENKSPRFEDNLKFIDLPSTKIKGFEAFFHSFLATMYCLIIRPDIVHIHNIGPGIFIPLLRYGFIYPFAYNVPKKLIIEITKTKKADSGSITNSTSPKIGDI